MLLGKLAGLLFCVSTALALSADMDATPLLESRENMRDSNIYHQSSVCIVVRTYWRHGSRYSGSLARLLASLHRQKHSRWEALLVIMDNTPFEELDEMLRNLDDDRVWTYANWVHSDFAPKDKDGTWKPLYHDKLYNLTDEAARACAPGTEWVVFTNGDNEYHEDAFAMLDGITGDAVAWDMYSRYQRPTGVPCERFQAAAGVPPCKVNRMRWCHTDLGSVAYRWPRLIREGLRFGTLQQNGRFTGQDGLMAELVVRNGWTVHHEEGRCLFDQGPNPHMCARLGGVWDERSAMTSADFGGHCISVEAASRLEQDPGVEALDVELSHDGNLAGLSAGIDPVTRIKCLRPAHDYKFMLIPPFGPGCMEPADEGLMLEYREMVRKKAEDASHSAVEKAAAMDARGNAASADQTDGHDEL